MVVGVDGYKQNTDDATLEQFVQEHSGLVRKIALYIKRRLPSHIDLNDMLQAGLVGLLEARSQYRVGTGASFETYASIRVHGAIIDSLRKNSWVSRDTVKNMRKISVAINKVEQREQKQATTEDIAKELGISMEEFFKMSQEVSISSMVSLEEIDVDNSFLTSEKEENPQEITQDVSIKEHLKTILENLPEREQLVLSLYYIEEFTLKQIGDILDLSEARVCQLHSQAIARIRAKMKRDEQP